MRNVLSVATTIAIFVMPSPSYATSDPPSVRVLYGDLDLSTTIGRARFDRRLAAAVRAVCPAVDIRDVRASQANRSCLAKARAGAQRVAAAVTSRRTAIASTDADRPDAQ